MSEAIRAMARHDAERVIENIGDLDMSDREAKVFLRHAIERLQEEQLKYERKVVSS